MRFRRAAFNTQLLAKFSEEAAEIIVSWKYSESLIQKPIKDRWEPIYITFGAGNGGRIGHLQVDPIAALDFPQKFEPKIQLAKTK